MSNNYITITLNDGTAKKFATIEMQPVWMKSAQFEKLMSGHMDVQLGHVYKVYQYVIRLTHTPEDLDYGSLADLNAMYELCNPAATPSARFKLTDHYGEDFESCYFYGNYAPRPITTIIEGGCAHYLIPLEIIITATRYVELDFSQSGHMLLPVLF